MGKSTLAPKTPKKRSATVATNDESIQPAKKRSFAKKATTATDVEADEPVTPKKRASPKKKNATDVKVKTEDGETDEVTEGLEPVTPKKGTRALAKGKANDATNGSTEASVSPTKGNGAPDGMTTHNTPRKRQAPKKETAAPRGIPSSWEKADAADRMMVTMKEKGEGWNDIRATWKELTGQDTAPR